MGCISNICFLLKRLLSNAVNCITFPHENRALSSFCPSFIAKNICVPPMLVTKEFHFFSILCLHMSAKTKKYPKQIKKATTTKPKNFGTEVLSVCFNVIHLQYSFISSIGKVFNVNSKYFDRILQRGFRNLDNSRTPMNPEKV